MPYALKNRAGSHADPSLIALRSMLRFRHDLASEATLKVVQNQLSLIAAEQLVVDQELSCWVGLFLDPEAAASLAVPGDGMAAPEELHITMVMAKGLTLLQAAQFVVACQMAASMQSPLAGAVGGQGRFWDPQGDGMDVVYAAPDVPEMEDLQNCLESCIEDMYGVPILENHGWTPHITLGSVPAGQAFDTQVVAVPLELGILTVMVNDFQIDLPLTGSTEEEGGYWGMYSERARVASEQAQPVEFAALCASHEDGAEPAIRFFMDVGQQFMEAPSSFNVLPKPATYKHPIYGDIVITRERNANFVANFNSGVYQKDVAIDAEHETKLSGALGWIKKLAQNKDGSVDASEVTWNKRGKDLLADDRFHYISPEWYEEWRNPATGTVYNDVLVGAAITTRPFFKEDSLRPLGVMVASEKGLRVNQEITHDDGVNVVTHRFQFMPATGEPSEEEDHMSRETNGAQTPPNQAAETITPAQFAEMQSQMAELRAAREADQATITTLREANDTERSARLATEQASRSQRYSDMALGRGGEDDGRRWLGEPRIHVNMLEMLRSASEQGEDSETFKDYVALQRSIAAQTQANGMGAFREVGRGGEGNGAANAGDQALTMATKLASEEKIPLVEAQARIAREHPELMDRNRREVIDQKG